MDAVRRIADQRHPRSDGLRHAHQAERKGRRRGEQVERPQFVIARLADANGKFVAAQIQ